MEQSPNLETGACEGCGTGTSIRIADRWLCADCYAVRGACCHEFAGDDLTQPDAGRPEAARPL